MALLGRSVNYLLFETAVNRIGCFSPSAFCCSDTVNHTNRAALCPALCGWLLSPVGMLMGLRFLSDSAMLGLNALTSLWWESKQMCYEIQIPLYIMGSLTAL